MQCAERQRLFVAIQLPEDVKGRIESAQAELRDTARRSSIRWTRREQFHLTLRFLGNVEAGRIEDLANALRRSCGSSSPIELCAKGIGFFPNVSRPRVIWSGVQDERGELVRLHRAVESAVCGFTDEKAEERFTGHVTVGRMPRMEPGDARRLVSLATEMGERAFGQWLAGHVELVRSDPSPQGARYTTLSLFPLS